MDGMWQSFLLISHVSLWVTLYDNVHMYHSNRQLTSWVGENKPVHVGKEDKQVKQHYYVTHHRNYTDESLQYDNTSQRLSCQVERRKYLPTWTACDRVSYYFLHVCQWVTLYDNVHMYHSNNQLTIWIGGNGPVHVGKEDRQVKQCSPSLPFHLCTFGVPSLDLFSICSNSLTVVKFCPSTGVSKHFLSRCNAKCIAWLH